MERGSFGTKIGVVLATAGSAVGLGNIWRFPYITGEDGGAAFIVVYLVAVAVLGIPGMVAEFVVGRHGAANAPRAYSLVGGKAWSIVGYMGVLTSVIILGFYSVVAGWCVQYLFASLLGQLNGDATYVKNYFQQFSTDPIKPLLWTIVFIILTHLVVVRGVRRGIEKVSNVLMPVLFVLLLLIVVASCMLPGAIKGVEFLLKPDFSKVNADVFLDALGQAFFALSLGTACLCTYASYFGRDINLLKSAGQIAFIDSMVAILAGLMIFPAAFSVGVDADSGPSLIFITLPNVFNQAFSAIPSLGYVIGILFYSLLAVAALTSTISMHEIGTAFFQEEMRLSRKVAVVIVTTVASVVCVLSSISMGACPGAMLWGKPLLSFFDFLTAQLMMPAGAFLTTLYVGWVAPKSKVYKQFTNGGMVYAQFFPYFLFLVRFVCPTCILLIFLHELGWI